jgi:hypothetical protein
VNVPVVRQLVLGHSRPELDGAVAAYERDRTNLLSVEGGDPGEIMSNLLAAQFVRHRMDDGMDINAAFREYGNRVKSMFKPKPIK